MLSAIGNLATRNASDSVRKRYTHSEALHCQTGFSAGFDRICSFRYRAKMSQALLGMTVPCTRQHTGVNSKFQRPALSLRYRMKHCTSAAAAIELPSQYSKARPKLPPSPGSLSRSISTSTPYCFCRSTQRGIWCFAKLQTQNSRPRAA